MENPGIDPGASRMQIERSTTWASPPIEDTNINENKNYSTAVEYTIPLC